MPAQETCFFLECQGRKDRRESLCPPIFSPCMSGCNTCLASLHLSEKGWTAPEHAVLDQSTVLILHSSGFCDFSGDWSSKRKGIYTADKGCTNSRTEAFLEKYHINLHSKSKPAFPFPTHIFPSRTFWNRDSTLPESLCFARLFSPSPKHELRTHAAAPQQQHSAPAALPAAAGSWWRWRRLLRRLPRLLSSSSPALIVRLCWPRSSVLCPGAIATLFAPWGRSTSPGSGPSLASEESAGYFSSLQQVAEAGWNQMQTTKWFVKNFVAISEGFALCGDTGCCYSWEPIAGEGRAVCRKYCFCLLTNSCRHQTSTHSSMHIPYSIA